MTACAAASPGVWRNGSRLTGGCSSLSCQDGCAQHVNLVLENILMDTTRRDLWQPWANRPRRALLGKRLPARPAAHQRHPRPSDCVARLGRRPEGPPNRRSRSPGRSGSAKSRDEQGRSLLLDAGDCWGDTMIADRTKGSALVAALNHLEYDAMTMGNHEPDFGREGMKTLVAKPASLWSQRTSWPVPAASCLPRRT